jgi:sulfite exporter TauE/SafE
LNKKRRQKLRSPPQFCKQRMESDLTLILSLISLGFFGGFSHCASMCGPFVITQVSQNLKNTPLENFSNFQKLKNYALLPYQLGRITTYSLIGFFCAFFSQNIDDLFHFRIFSAALLLIASLFFLTLLFERNLLRFKLPFLESLASFFLKKFSVFFIDPRGIRGYFLGLVLGLIPCGLLYGAFLIAATISQPILATFGMFLFGLATFPSLFLTACGGHFLIKFSGFKILTKLVIAINAIMLLFMSLKLIF